MCTPIEYGVRVPRTARLYPLSGLPAAVMRCEALDTCLCGAVLKSGAGTCLQKRNNTPVDFLRSLQMEKVTGSRIDDFFQAV